MNDVGTVKTCRNLFDEVLNCLPSGFDFIKESCYIAGGAIVSTLQKTEIQDIDVYFRDENSRDKFVKLATSFGFNKTVNCYETFCSKLNLNVQFIVTFTGTPEEMIENFDFIHCKVAYDYVTNNVVYGNPKKSMSVIKAIYNKKLAINPGCKYPIRAIERMAKFCNRGYELENRFVLQFLPLIFSLNVLDQKVLEEQLTGLYGTRENSAKELSKQLHGMQFNNKMDNLLKGDSN